MKKLLLIFLLLPLFGIAQNTKSKPGNRNHTDTITARTFPTSDSSNKVATTKFVKQLLANYTSGLYTPASPTLTTNAAAATAYQLTYTRIGDVITISGKLDIDPTSTGAVEVRLSLPLSPGAFSNDYEAGGTAVCGATGEAAAISAVSGASVIAFKYIATSTSNNSFFFTATFIWIAP